MNVLAKTMDTPLLVEQLYSASLEKVWQALTDQNALRIWYFPQLLKFEPVVGFDIVFSDDGSSFKKKWRVTQVINDKKIAHTWSYQGYRGSSNVIFDLVSAGEGTRLTLTHTGLASFPSDPHFARHRFEEGWKWILGTKLKHYLE
jgi:uncharacterized protein YndB with AHSA1/START domain